MNWYRLGMLGSLLLAFLVVTAHAEEPAPVAWGATSPAFGPCGLNIPAGTLAMGGNVLFAKSNGIWKNDERLNGNVKATKFNEIFKFRYGIMDGLDIRSATPVYNVHLDKKNRRQP